MIPMDAIWLFSGFDLAFPATLRLHRSASGIAYTSEKLSKMAGNSASYPHNSW